MEAAGVTMPNQRTGPTEETLERRARAERTVREMVQYDPTADAYIYTLRCTRKSDESVWYYVGAARRSPIDGAPTKPMIRRLIQHMKDGGSFKGTKRVDGMEIVAELVEVEYGIELIDLNCYHRRDFLDKDQFERRVRYLEQKTRSEVEARLGGMCLGGK